MVLQFCISVIDSGILKRTATYKPNLELGLSKIASQAELLFSKLSVIESRDASAGIPVSSVKRKALDVLYNAFQRLVYLPNATMIDQHAYKSGSIAGSDSMFGITHPVVISNDSSEWFIHKTTTIHSERAWNLLHFSIQVSLYTTQLSVAHWNVSCHFAQLDSDPKHNIANDKVSQQQSRRTCYSQC